MPLFIRKPALDAALDDLADRQPVRLSRTAMATAILERVVSACERDAEAWRQIGGGRRKRGPQQNGAKGATPVRGTRRSA